MYTIYYETKQQIGYIAFSPCNIMLYTMLFATWDNWLVAEARHPLRHSSKHPCRLDWTLVPVCRPHINLLHAGRLVY